VFDVIRIMSLAPGRVRFKIPELKNSAPLAATVRARVTGLPGVEDVEINRTTGSMLVRYDKRLFVTDESVQALTQALAGQMSSEERDYLRALLQPEESVQALWQTLAEVLSPQEQERFYRMLQFLASQP